MARAKPSYRPNYFNVHLGEEDLGTFDDRTLTLDDAFAVENETGMTLNEMLTGIDPGKARALRAIVWFMRYKQGKPVPLAAINFVLTDLEITAMADPTVAKGSPSTEATATSGTAS